MYLLSHKRDKKKSLFSTKNKLFLIRQAQNSGIDNKKIEKYIDKFLSLENPTRELIVNLVEKIYIYQDKTIDIIFSFNNKMV